MPMALPDNGYVAVIKPSVKNLTDAPLAERCEDIAKRCDLNAKALEDKMQAEDRKSIGLSHAWFSEMHNGQVTIVVRVGAHPVLFAGQKPETPAILCKNSVGAAKLFREVSKALRAGELNAEVTDAIKAGKMAAGKRKARNARTK